MSIAQGERRGCRVTSEGASGKRPTGALRASPVRQMTTYEIVPCPVCGTEDTEEIAGTDDIRAEVEALWEFHGERLHPAVPPAHLFDRVCFSLHPPLRIGRCVECGLVFRNPREREFEVRDVYAGEAPDNAVLQSLHDAQRSTYAEQARRLTDIAGRPGRVLEVGSYVGGFLCAAHEMGWDVLGVDINRTANAFTRDLGVPVIDGDLSSVDQREFDALTIWNCFDQLPDPAGVLAMARQCIRHGGLVSLRVPNGAFYATVRRQLGTSGDALARALLAHNNLLTFPYRHGFTPSSLERLARRTGFSVMATYGDTLVPTADEWTQPWARWEERVVKSALRELSNHDADTAPWFEMYLTKR